MTSRTDTLDLLDDIRSTIEKLPHALQEPVWQRVASAAQAYQRRDLTDDEFVSRLIPANLFTAEEFQLLKAKGALPEIAQA